jgi:CHAT domain-containing protein
LDTPLVTLSACETGLGHTKESAEVRAVLPDLESAGARSVVSPLWRSVADKYPAAPSQAPEPTTPDGSGGR